MLTCYIGDWTKSKLSYALDVTASCSNYNMILMQQPDKEKLLILK